MSPYAINDPPDRFLASSISCFEIIDGLAFPYVFIPYFSFELLRSPFVLKLFSAISAFVMLYISPFPALLYPRIIALGTLFLCMVFS